MPRDKDLKRLVRSRMKKTGEAYTAARAQLLEKSPPAKRAGKSTAATAPASIDYAKLAGMSDAVMKEKTGRTWDSWVEVLDGHDAHTMSHRDIAKLVNGTYGAGPWWGQMVTVGYERIKGLRARGQRRDGSYEANKSRTFPVPTETLFDAWADAATRRRFLDGATVKVRTATRPKSMRFAWSDGTIVAVWIEPKGKGKAAVSIAHMKLPDKETANRLKRYWGERLDALGEVLAER